VVNVSTSQRQTAGNNNKKGNRYEDFFAIERMIELAPVVLEGVPVTLAEQTGDPVDDLVVREGGSVHYAQLKNDLEITWGADGGKLRKEFVEQKRTSEERGEQFTLTAVVAYDLRKRSLDTHLPTELNGAVTIRWFPEPAKPSELARRRECREPLRQVAASQEAGENELIALVEGFALAWIERDYGKATDLSDIIGWLRGCPHFRLRRPLPVKLHSDWPTFLTIIQGIDGMACFWDRGYFEWSFGIENGIPYTCDSDEFRQFISLVVKQQPTTFEDFETLL